MTGPPIEEVGPAHVFEAASGGGHGVGSLPLADLAREHRNSGVADVPSSASSRPYCSIRRSQLGRKASRKRLQAHRREPVRTIGMTPVESGRQRPARCRMPLRKQPQARNHQLGECRARLHDQKYGMRPTRSGRSHAAGSRRFAEKAESRRCLNSYAGSAKSNPFSSGRRIGTCRSANSLQLAARSMT